MSASNDEAQRRQIISDSASAIALNNPLPSIIAFCASCKFIQI
ncbi:hypothetical protein [Nostoc sphaeroides]|uniref:Uncharacterized protein n=1 Tax=Nostoc sphaeroides CCNUC1 TaxID=2653204 RepID=A0A5P8WCY4_9NOSO|nr:hypothetical protein [Nostoc sphaeroides]QFS50675.1 hypothetical protein GXM_08169 [Nostoc sphaeroides CCNUC1]